VLGPVDANQGLTREEPEGTESREVSRRCEQWAHG
jgi:hypothetical protein